MTELTQRDIQDLKQAGYSEEQIAKAIEEVNHEETGQRKVAGQGQQLSSFQSAQNENLIKFQLELNDILERAEHILRQDQVQIENGNMIWVGNQEKEEIVFTEYAVQEIMRVLSMYINRNTILSDYEPKEIDDKIFDFGCELNDLIFMKYEDFFNYVRPLDYAQAFGFLKLDDVPDDLFEEIEKAVAEDLLPKKKLYPIITRELIDLVHSAYKRALYGAERDSLRTARAIQQQETIMPQGLNINTGEMRKERGILNPMRFVAGRYK